MKKNKLLNPLFWFGVLSVVFLAAGIDPESLTNWPLVWEGLVSILISPVKFVTVFTAVYTMFNDNGTKGLDNPFKK